jgi:hypothetical protein
VGLQAAKRSGSSGGSGGAVIEPWGTLVVDEQRVRWLPAWGGARSVTLPSRGAASADWPALLAALHLPRYAMVRVLVAQRYVYGFRAEFEGISRGEIVKALTFQLQSAFPIPLESVLWRYALKAIERGRWLASVIALPRALRDCVAAALWRRRCVLVGVGLLGLDEAVADCRGRVPAWRFAPAAPQRAVGRSGTRQFEVAVGRNGMVTELRFAAAAAADGAASQPAVGFFRALRLAAPSFLGSWRLLPFQPQLWAAAAIALALVWQGGRSAAELDRRTDELAALRGAAERLAEPARQARDLTARLATRRSVLADISGGTVSVTQFLDDWQFLTRTFDGDTFFAALNLTGPGEWQVQGLTPDAPQLAQFLPSVKGIKSAALVGPIARMPEFNRDLFRMRLLIDANAGQKTP